MTNGLQGSWDTGENDGYGRDGDTSMPCGPHGDESPTQTNTSIYRGHGF